jgi:hypothetical protein
MLQSRSSVLRTNEEARVTIVYLHVEDHLEGDPPPEWIDAQLEIRWQKDHSEPERRLAALSRLQTLVGKEIAALSMNPDDER